MLIVDGASQQDKFVITFNWNWKSRGKLKFSRDWEYKCTILEEKRKFKMVLRRELE